MNPMIRPMLAGDVNILNQDASEEQWKAIRNGNKKV